MTRIAVIQLSLSSLFWSITSLYLDPVCLNMAVTRWPGNPHFLAFPSHHQLTWQPMLSLRSLSLLAWFYLCFVISFTQADIKNVTIDDLYGDIETGAKPIYSSSGWSQGPCNGCKAQPNASLAFEGSWHDATHHPEDTDPERTVTLTFRGPSRVVLHATINNLSYEQRTQLNRCRRICLFHPWKQYWSSDHFEHIPFLLTR